MNLLSKTETDCVLLLKTETDCVVFVSSDTSRRETESENESTGCACAHRIPGQLAAQTHAHYTGNQGHFRALYCGCEDRRKRLLRYRNSTGGRHYIVFTEYEQGH